jgi:hypothetical protein
VKGEVNSLVQYTHIQTHIQPHKGIHGPVVVFKSTLRPSCICFLSFLWKSPKRTSSTPIPALGKAFSGISSKD